MLPQQYCLRWKHHHTNVQSMFSQLLEKERFCDVTLYCSASFGSTLSRDSPGSEDNLRGVSLRAHRVVLAACSELLASLLGAHDAEGGGGPPAEPVLVIDGAEPRHMRALLDYMYTGEMNVHHSQLASLLKTAEELRIKGLSDIRWSGKDEPPDSKSGAVTATAAPPERLLTSAPADRTQDIGRITADRTQDVGRITADRTQDVGRITADRFNVNGGPPPLIKLPVKTAEKTSPSRRREQATDTGDAPMLKRQRITSRSDHTDEEEREPEWHHGNLDITAEKVSGWGGGETENSRGSWESGNTEDEWAEPQDIASFLHTRLQVDGDNSGDEERVDNGVGGSEHKSEMKPEVTVKPISQLMPTNNAPPKLTNTTSTPTVAHMLGRSSGQTDPRFLDVVKLNEYLLHGRRPQFWEEDYVRRVMEAVRLKELEMKQAAEILGVSYGTLYGRYRDVYGCINRPYRMKDFWTEQGPAEVLMRLQRGECTLGAAAEALAVSPHNLATYLAGLQPPATIQLDDEPEFEPIPIEGEPIDSRQKKTYASSSQAGTPICPIKSMRKNVAAAEKAVKKILIGSLSSDNEDSIPVSIISQRETRSSKPGQLVKSTSGSGASSSGATSPSSLMRSRPDLTIVASSTRQDT